MNADREAIISFRGVEKSYDENGVLCGVNLDIPRGEFLTVVGGSGGGKTTLLKMVNGLVRPDAGRVLVGGQDIADMDVVRLRRNIGYVIQGTGLFPHMTVAGNIGYVPSLLGVGRKEARQEAERLLKLLGLEPEMIDRYPSELSGGQQQRVGIARALAAKPEIMLMDEPFGAVDEITRKSLQEEIARLHRELELTIMFVTHDVREALRLGTRVLILNDGGIAQLGTPEEVRNSPADEFVRELMGRT